MNVLGIIDACKKASEVIILIGGTVKAVQEIKETVSKNQAAGAKK